MKNPLQLGDGGMTTWLKPDLSQMGIVSNHVVLWDNLGPLNIGDMTMEGYHPYSPDLRIEGSIPHVMFSDFTPKLEDDYTDPPGDYKLVELISRGWAEGTGSYYTPPGATQEELSAENYSLHLGSDDIPNYGSREEFDMYSVMRFEESLLGDQRYPDSEPYSWGAAGGTLNVGHIYFQRNFEPPFDPEVVFQCTTGNGEFGRPLGSIRMYHPVDWYKWVICHFWHKNGVYYSQVNCGPVKSIRGDESFEWYDFHSAGTGSIFLYGPAFNIQTTFQRIHQLSIREYVNFKTAGDENRYDAIQKWLAYNNKIKGPCLGNNSFGIII